MRNYFFDALLAFFLRLVPFNPLKGSRTHPCQVRCVPSPGVLEQLCYLTTSTAPPAFLHALADFFITTPLPLQAL